MGNGIDAKIELKRERRRQTPALPALGAARPPPEAETHRQLSRHRHQKAGGEHDSAMPCQFMPVREAVGDRDQGNDYG